MIIIHLFLIRSIILICWAALLGGTGLALAEVAQKPNIVLIMADDIGTEGLACYNSAIYTSPNLDRLAANGAVFNC